MGRDRGEAGAGVAARGRVRYVVGVGLLLVFLGGTAWAWHGMWQDRHRNKKE